MFYVYVLRDASHTPIYVGVTTSPERRLKQHRWRTPGAFELEVLEAVEVDFGVRERFWIAQFRERGAQLLNRTSGGQRMRLGPRQPHTDEAKRKVGEAHRGKRRGPPSEETRAKISAAKRGKPRTAEHSAKLSAALRGKPKAPFSEEHRLHIWEAAIRREAERRQKKHSPDA